ncbi:replication termination factor 2 isoform X1 [Strongylocentrotus purpuratus]|uniref:Replication termination factor 2 n=1 Tax=Strongylocentrotus purpuratus TaxID=7668 RepID=A0A7M7SXV4_STRPU|nr:replication termination factor 2 isoform X1 [Strongylocentrotus purpuratus]|eukprot:XP_011679200.1 PREDICTED: protein RTF2 homolog [Strongylocentrotus purpuratus]
MGGDGGSIPGRQDLVRTKRKPEKADQNMERVARWHHCALTQEKLRQPMVACELGRLYNKEAVLECLLDKSKSESALHIKSLKDVKQLVLTDNPAYQGQKGEKGDGYVDTHTAPYICPVTGLEMNGKYRFCFIWHCGCVVSEKAFKEVKSDVCHKCGKDLSIEDGILINGSEEDVKILTEKMNKRRALAKAEKKAKKAQKRKVDGVKEQAETKSAGAPSAHSDSSSDKQSTKAISLNKKFIPGKKEGTATGVITGKPEDVPGRSHKQDLDPSTTRPEYNSKKTEVYKSLFLSKNKDEGEKSPWVTYNPYYAMRN